MPNDLYNPPPICSIFPAIPKENGVGEISGVGSESSDTADTETTIAPSPVYEALYGNNETPKPPMSFNETEIPSVNTDTETPYLRPETPVEKSKPKTPGGKISSDKEMNTKDKTSSLADGEEKKFREMVNEIHS